MIWYINFLIFALLFLLLWLLSSVLAMGLALNMGFYWKFENKIPDFQFVPIINTVIGLYLLGVLIWRKIK
jgi:hypothetical protein